MNLFIPIHTFSTKEKHKGCEKERNKELCKGEKGVMGDDEDEKRGGPNTRKKISKGFWAKPKKKKSQKTNIK